MKSIIGGIAICRMVMAFVVLCSASAGCLAAERAESCGQGADAAPAASQPCESTAEDVGQDWLQEHGISVAARLSQFYQGIADGDGEHGYEYGGKADARMNLDLSRLGLWDGFSMTVQADLNFGDTINGQAGVLIPPNTALNSPGIEGADAFDISSFYFTRTFGKQGAVLVGKLNMLEVVANKPFMGGAGINSFWNHTFTATPSGTVPPYLFGALGSVFTEQATYRLWIFDPNSYTNVSVLDNAFSDGVSFRGNVDFNLTIGGRQGHQGLTAYYSTKDGTDLSGLGDILLPPLDPGTIDSKDSRWYFSYSFDQALGQVPIGSDDSFGLFGNVGVSDGNPNGLRWSMYFGIGGKGLFRWRNRDAWGIGYYYDGISSYVKEVLPITDEQGLEIFYDFTLTPMFSIGADMQIIDPGLASDTAVIPGLRAVIRL